MSRYCYAGKIRMKSGRTFKNVLTFRSVFEQNVWGGTPPPLFGFLPYLVQCCRRSYVNRTVGDWRFSASTLDIPFVLHISFVLTTERIDITVRTEISRKTLLRDPPALLARRTRVSGRRLVKYYTSDVPVARVRLGRP